MLLASNVSACEKAVVLSFSGDWQPYFYRIQDSTYSGDDFELLEQVLTSMSCYLNVLPMTERRVSRELAKGMFDVSLGASYTDERNQDYHFSIPYRQEHVGFIMLASNQRDTESLEQLLADGHFVAMNLEGFFGDTVAQLLNQYPQQFIHMFDLNGRLQLLRDASVTAVIDDYHALCKSHRAEGFNTFVVSQRILHTADVHFMFNRATVSVDWVTEFNQQLLRRLNTAQTTTNKATC
ncbi:transporter substrate-binding domain-containing protein [Alteromonas sp. ASW11-36]|uniref:Transporter substrate-binding domain-containing protein n=1 Tax=Alteromonas arenosi TaxID=3055817 RepID=A0ABT7SUW4_9ALTE|nr:transporter substrate-binding domain-containing protein [Alteromonas sp. ASW11-36]MDM7859977.1 transporter substrate-binding domain-containing protein [Alteromonas sp. ASW11-36]